MYFARVPVRELFLTFIISDACAEDGLLTCLQFCPVEISPGCQFDSN
jgi:hypothetical protein